MRHTENFVRRWLYGTRLPLAGTIAVTDKCQCKCVHCSAANRTRPASSLSLEELQRVVRESVNIGATNVTLTGGEPLLRDDLEAAVSAVPQDKAVSLVFTNGLGLTPERARRLKSAGLFVGLSTYATNSFVREERLRKMADLGASWGVHELTVFDAIPAGRLGGHKEALLTPQNRMILLREAQGLRRKYRARMHVITQSWTNSRSGFARYNGCLAGHYQFHISAGGDFRPCDFTRLSIGNVRQESVAGLWKKLTSRLPKTPSGLPDAVPVLSGRVCRRAGWQPDDMNRDTSSGRKAP